MQILVQGKVQIGTDKSHNIMISWRRITKSPIVSSDFSLPGCSALFWLQLSSHRRTVVLFFQILLLSVGKMSLSWDYQGLNVTRLRCPCLQPNKWTRSSLHCAKLEYLANTKYSAFGHSRKCLGWNLITFTLSFLPVNNDLAPWPVTLFLSC